MLSKSRLKKIIEENQAYLNALEELDRTGKLKKVNFKERVNFTLDGNLINQFRKYASKNNLKMSNIIENMIKDYLKKS